MEEMELVRPRERFRPSFAGKSGEVGESDASEEEGAGCGRAETTSIEDGIEGVLEEGVCGERETGERVEVKAWTRNSAARLSMLFSDKSR